MEKSDIFDLIERMSHSGLTELTIQQEGFTLTLKNEKTVIAAAPAPVVMSPVAAPVAVAPAEAAAAVQTAPAAGRKLIKSPMVGVFYRKPKPGAPNFVEVGTVVQAQQTVCIIEAMKLFNEIEASLSGTIVEILVQDGQAVVYDQPLFAVTES